MEYIFLAGVHGVGKSTLGARIKDKLSVKCMSVSDLIRKSGNNLKQEDKYTAGISHNQELWKEELKKLSIEESILLLDGHFCLLNEEGEVTSLPFSTFNNTKMKSIILMKHKPEVLRERLLSRDKVDYSLELIRELQETEVERAYNYSKIKNVKMFIYDEVEPFNDLINFIKKQGCNYNGT
ncbi:ATP-binding protein [Ornithinibacillus bavariensis]|uniref:AAA family ATPase n=1 Tax=Ornithinibacillus bavariensis TaxID=545502 RepID=A0A919XD20_9BACI|nr:ATP-binding protein [Ornithinibacillus bavariensis]GIO28293.1 hypothetical protein J43TS3_29040 [Ornithinibacillus bavariensis]